MTSIRRSLAVVVLTAFASAADAGVVCCASWTGADVLHQENSDEPSPISILLEEEEEEEEEDEEPDCE